MIGKIISHYKIVEKLGEGGMGVVYKAEDTKLKRTVALKFLSQQTVGGEEEKKRFIHEAQAAAALHHPNICTVHEIDEAEGQTFIVMTYLAGESLKQKTDQGPLKLDEAIELAMQIAQGLQEAHEHGIIHRDIKSSNVMVTNKDQAVLTDFGLAKQRGQTLLTKEGMTIGTISYMSPEQAQGAPLDHRTDIFSLGVILYEMMTGQLPFKGDHELAVLYSIMNEEPETMTGLRTDAPRELERITKQALAKNPAERYQNVNDMLIDLREVAKALEAGKTTSTKISLVKDLLERRVPQIVAFYSGLSWAIIEVVKWLVNRYPLSPHLPELSFTALVSVIPTVLLLAYFHGKQRRHRLTLLEKIAIPVNVVATAALLFFMFGNKDLGAATNKVMLPDVAGKTIEQLVPKSEFRKRLAVYFFENESGDATLNWLQYGIMHLVDFDLDQDPFVVNIQAYYQDFKGAGYENAVGAPLPLKKKIAADNHHPYFVTGSFTQQHGAFTIKSMLYETKRTRLMAARTFTGRDLFLLADSVSVQLKGDLQIPDYYIEAAEDLPVAEMFTKSLAAFKLYRAGQYALWQRDFSSAAPFFEKATQEDSTFAFAYYQLHNMYANLNRRAQAEQAIRGAMKYSYKLPRMWQFWVKDAFYKIQGDWQSAAENARLFVTLFPRDPQGYYELAYYYGRMNQPERAIAEYLRILELDPGSHFNLRNIGDLLKEKGEYEQALKYYEYYAKMYPGESRSFTAIGNLYRSIGKHENARDYYKKALLLEPESVAILTDLAGIEASQGNFTDAERQYRNVLLLAKRPEERSIVHQALSNYYKVRGRIADAIEHYELYLAEVEKYASPLNVLLAKSDVFGTVELYILAGKPERAWQVAREYDAQAQQLVPPWNSAAPYLYIWYYTWLENAENVNVLEEHVEKIEAFIKEANLEFVRPYMRFARGIIHEFRDEYPMAIAEYEEALTEMEPPNYYKCFVRTLIGRWYRDLQQYNKAEASLQKALELEPFFPNAHYELALVYHEMGKSEKALEHLNTALKVWEEADIDYKHAQEAREKLAEWQIVSGKSKAQV